MTSGRAIPLSLASDDFDVDGVDDIAAGFATPAGGVIAIHRGNLDAFAPQSQASFEAIGRGEYAAPYLPEARLLEIPVRPDFLAAGDFIGANGPGVVAASKGGRTLYVMGRGRSGNFEILQTVPLPGSITALSSHPLMPGKYWQVVLGVRASDGPHLAIYTGSSAGLTPHSSFQLTEEATSFAFGNLDTGYLTDVLVVAGGRVSILHNGSQTLEPIPLPYTVMAAAVGKFVFDRTPIHQIALLTAGGSVHIVAHEGIDSRPLTRADFLGRSRWKAIHPDRSRAALEEARAVERPVVWKEVERHVVGAITDAEGRVPHFFQTRLTNNAADDVMLFGSAGMSMLVHPGENPAAEAMMDHADLGADAVAALPLRVNISARRGVVYLTRGDTRLTVLAPHDPPRFVNRTDDPAPTSPITNACNNTSTSDVSSSCSLREAILRANADNAGDTITLAAGTYTLTRAKIYHDFTGNQGTLEVKASMNIVGASAATTIIQAGTSNPATCIGAYPVPSPFPLLTNAVYEVYTPYPNTSACTSVDKIFSFNQDIDSSFCSSGNVPTTTPTDPSGAPAPALPFTVAASCAGDNLSNGTVSLSNVTLQNGFNRGNPSGDADGFGGAFDWDTGSAGTARLTITNCIIQNNLGFQGAGATFFNFTNPSINFNLADPTVTISNTVIQNNVANFVDPFFDMHELGEVGSGGGLAADVDTRLKLTNTQVLNNTATQIAESRNGINTFDWSAGGTGGLLLLGQISAIDALHNSTISGNLGLGVAGGINNTASLVIDTGTVISGNQAVEQGAGLETNGGTNSTTHVSDTLTISNVTFLNNTLVACNTLSTTSLCNSLNAFSAITVTGGGAILQGNLSGAPPATFQFNRFFGNSGGSGGGDNVYNRSTNITATDNFWGTNDSTAIANSISNHNGTTGCSPCTATTTFDPFIVLTLAGNPATIDAGQTSTLTADFLHDNHGTAVALSNIGVLLGLPITFNNASHGTLSNPQGTIQSTGTATATFTGTTPGGVGGAHAVVDNGTATGTVTVDEPVSVTGSPTNQTVCAPNNATFTGAASGFPVPTVQWQVSTNGGATFNNLGGATSNPLIFATSGSQNNNQYLAVFSNTTTTGAHTAQTTAATLTVNTSPTVNTNPTNQTVTAGQTATFSAAATGQPVPTVQWQVSTDGGATFSNIGGAISATLNVAGTTVGMNGNKYRAAFTNSCSVTPSSAATLTVNPPVTVVSYNVIFGTAPESFNLTTSTRVRLPWDITGIQVVFSGPVSTASVGSITGVTANSLSGVGTSTLTWTLATPIPIGSFSTALLASGPNGLKDANGNFFNAGVNFPQNFKVLWGDFNDDGVVNASDLVLINNARAAPYNLFADLNGDGVVNATDVNIVRMRGGTSEP